MTETSPPDPQGHPDTLTPLLAEIAGACRQSDRGDLEQRVRIAEARIRRPSVVVCVVGEFKQGKSSLVNALIGRDVCPVDDDLATSVITVVGYGDEPVVVVRRTEEGKPIVEQIELSRVRDFASEAGHPDNRRSVEMVEVAVPSPLLRRGLVIVDTPGVGAVRAGRDAAVLSFLPFADALILASDASAELTPGELRFLALATESCPTVMVALTKIDLYPDWRRIAELNISHLGRVGLHDPPVHLSSTLRSAAIRGKDRELNSESGFPDLLSVIETRVMERTVGVGAERAAADGLAALLQIRAATSSALEALEDPNLAEQRSAALEKASQDVARFRDAGAKWNVALNDGILDLRSDVDYRLRMIMRKHLQSGDERLSSSEPRQAWEEITSALQVDLAATADGLFSLIEDKGREIAERIATMIQDEMPDGTDVRGASFDVGEVWASTDRSLDTKRSGPFANGLTVLRGGYSGMLMLGMLGQLAGMAVLVPVTLGVGAVFGVKQFREARQRSVERERQQARTVLRQFVDQVQLELANRTHNAIKEFHRDLRDHFTGRIQELSATYTNAARTLQQTFDADRAKEQASTTELRRHLEHIEDLRRRTNALTGSEGGP